jgi:stearoyl-CoA desaturase (delta-9 desaturase)
MKLSTKDVLQSSPFILVHLAAISVFFIHYGPGHANLAALIALCLGSYALRMFAITAGYHRYFSHRSYKANRVFQFLMALLGSTSVQKGVLWWAAHHRLHHKYSDQPQDIHSPVQSGFFWSHVGWIISRQHDETRWDQIPDLAKYPELRFLNSFHLLPVVLYGYAMFLIAGWPGFAWGFLVSTVLLWHGTFFINSLAHVIGSRRYQTTDDSRNHFGLAVITLGEGWHNNHHCYMSSARQGFFWWEIDLSYYALKALSFTGMVSELRQPPLALLEAKRIKSTDRLATGQAGAGKLSSGKPVVQAV